jgi:hypothetical protein
MEMGDGRSELRDQRPEIRDQRSEIEIEIRDRDDEGIE